MVLGSITLILFLHAIIARWTFSAESWCCRKTRSLKNQPLAATLLQRSTNVINCTRNVQVYKKFFNLDFSGKVFLPKMSLINELLNLIGFDKWSNLKVHLSKLYKGLNLRFSQNRIVRGKTNCQIGDALVSSEFTVSLIWGSFFGHRYVCKKSLPDSYRCKKCCGSKLIDLK